MENYNWKDQVAQAITEPVPVLINEDTNLATALQVALNECKIPNRSLEFAQSMLDGFKKYGYFTDAQRPHVVKLINPPAEVVRDRETAETLRGMVFGYLLLGSDRDFAESMLRGYDMYGSFTEKQRPHAERMAARASQSHAQVNGEAITPTPCTPVQALAPSAPAGPLFPCTNILATVSLDKFARFTVGDLQLSLKNDGGLIWVKWRGQLCGSISAHGGYRETKKYASESFRQAALEDLLRIEKDPMGAAQAAGIATGRCSCCGRPLTDPVSIGFGIGPVCRARGWGM